MIASKGSKSASISQIPVSLIVSRIEAMIASTASDDCKRLQLEANRLIIQLFSRDKGRPEIRFSKSKRRSR
jgi:hypothetical protein